MAFSGINALVITAAVSVFLGYHFYKPVPPSMDNSSTYTMYLSTYKFINTLADMLHWLGIKDKRIFLQEASRYRENSNLKLKLDDPDVHVSETTFNGVPVLMYMPLRVENTKSLPALMYVHGGAYCIGSALSAQPFLLKLAKEAGVVGISIEYRLAPQHPYPAALHDCEAASRYVFEHATYLGIDSERIGVAGDSAGANMAAVLSQKFRDMGADPQFMYQMLIYPRVQGIDLYLPSHVRNTPYSIEMIQKEGIATYSLSYGGFSLDNIPKVVSGEHISNKSRKRLSQYVNHKNIPLEFVQNEYKPYHFREVTNVDEELEKFYLNPYVWPLMAESMEHLPPALVLTMGYDALRDDGLLYLKRLRDDGVETEHYHDEQGFHGVLTMLEYKAASRLQEKLVVYVKSRVEL